MLDVPGVVVLGHYGLELPGPDDDDVAEVRAAVHEAASGWPGVRVEDKGRTIAVHVREAERPAEATAALGAALDRIAVTHGLLVLPGKMVLELAPTGTPGKGTVVAREVEARDLRACLFAGDDVADFAAFSSLEDLAAGGILTVKVAVDGPETPSELRAAADEVVEGPAGLVRLLERLAV